LKQKTLTYYLKNNFLQCDTEFGNSNAFFSASKSGRSINSKYHLSDFKDYIAEIPGAALAVGEYRSFSDEKLERTISFKPLIDSNLYDLVSRFVVLSNDRTAEITDKEVLHNSTNIYYQYKTTKAIVPIGLTDYLIFSDLNSICHPFFENVFYIRDEGIEGNGLKRWVVHHRMIVKPECATLIVRSCHPRFEGPLPLQGIIPKLLKKKLFRIREKKWPNFPLMAVGEVVIPNNYNTEIRTQVKLIHE
jgi:hypothetical protein